MFLLIFVPAVAAAQTKQAKQSHAGDVDRARARTFFSQAEDAFSRDEFERAMRLFQQAQAAFFNESVKFNIAVCLERLNRFAEALAAYTQVQASPTIDASIKERASAAIARLQPPPKLPEPQAAAVPLPSPEVEPSGALAFSSQTGPPRLPSLRPVGWVGAAGAALGLAAVATVWTLGTANRWSYDNATEYQRAAMLADRADNYDLALKLSWALAVTGLATVAIDRLWRD